MLCELTAAGIMTSGKPRCNQKRAFRVHSTIEARCPNSPLTLPLPPSHVTQGNSSGIPGSHRAYSHLKWPSKCRNLLILRATNPWAQEARGSNPRAPTKIPIKTRVCREGHSGVVSTSAPQAGHGKLAARTPRSPLGLRLFANSLCQGQEKRTMRAKSELPAYCPRELATGNASTF
jgi:hypothetical protein